MSNLGMTEDSDHAAAMDAMYGFQRHIYDVTRPLFLFGRDRLIRHLDPPRGGTILEVGCGTARNLIGIAKTWPETRLHGIDISGAMLDTARRSISRAGLTDRITLRQADAGDLDVEAMFGLDEVDRILFSYTLSMMPSWRQAIRRAGTSLAPGGSIHIVDFGQYERLPKSLKRLHFASMNAHHVFPRRDLHEVLIDIAADLDLALRFEPLLRGYAWSAVLRRD